MSKSRASVVQSVPLLKTAQISFMEALGAVP